MNDQPQQPRTSWIDRAFRNPTVGMVGWAATVLSLVLAVYFYFASQELPDLTYFVSPSRTSIVATGDTPGIAITYKGRELSKNVSAAQIVIWNAGKRPIRHEDVLTPYVIAVEGNHPIVTAKIISITNPVIEFRLDEKDFESGRVALDWRVLEHNDGAIVQVIYEGDTAVSIQLSGISIGQRAIDARTQTQDFKPYKERTTRDKLAIYALLAFNAFLVLSLLLSVSLDADDFHKKRWRGVAGRRWVWLLIKLAVGGTLVGLTIGRVSATFWNPSPFG